MTFGSAPGPLRSSPLSSAGTFVFFRVWARHSPPSRLWDGTTHTLPPSGRHLLPHARSTFFMRFLRAHSPFASFPCMCSTPPSWPLLCCPGAVARPRPLSSSFTHHIPFPTSHSCDTPRGAALWYVPPPSVAWCMHAAICPSGLRPVYWRANTLRGIPHTSGMGTQLAGEALPLRVRGLCAPPPDLYGFVSTAAVASRPQTPGPRPSPR